MLNKASLQQIDWSARIKALPWQTVLARGPFWVSMLMVVLIARAAADMTWLVLLPKDTTTGTKRSVPVSHSTAGQVRLNQVVDLHLFGLADAKVVKTDAPIDAPKTNLKLVLRGVFSSSVPERAMAIIADAGGKEKLYRTGASVPGGATVHTIYSDRVILERSGRYETLNLPRDHLASNSMVRSPARSSQERGDGKQRRVKAPKKLKEMRDLIKKDPQALWKQVRIEPVLKNGKIEGYRLSHNDKQLMRALGIKKTDVIKEVNGYPLDDPSVLYELLGQFDTASEIRLSIERDGASEVLIVNM